MSTPPKHIIQKLAVEVNCPNPKTGMELHSQLSDTLQNRVLPELETLFDNLGDVRLERLEIDLGILPVENWENALREQFLKQCKLALQSADKKPGQYATNGPNSKQSAFEAYLLFLQKGHLPWWAEHRSLADLEREILDRRILRDRATQTALFALLGARPLALRRFVQQAGKALNEALWNLIKPNASAAKIAVPVEIRRLMKSGYSAAFTDRLCREATITAALHCQSKPETPFQAALARALLQLLQTPDRPMQPALAKALRNLLDQPDNTRKSKASGSRKSSGKTPKDELPFGKNELTEANSASDQTDTPQQENVNARTYVANAGLVLLHPFLLPFFESLGLLENNQFIDEAEKELAVQWLHLLATGNRECPEPELTLGKILCNMPLENPVGRWFEPKESQVAEAEAMLTALIRHWSALKNSSLAGLREGFLNRSGKLESLADGSLKLTVERQLQDVLLEQIPWNIGIIRLPWMRKLLYVEW